MQGTVILNLILSQIGIIFFFITGILLVKHRQVIHYFKDAFGFIKDDYESDFVSEYDGIFTEMYNVIKYGLKLLNSCNAQSKVQYNQDFDINRLITMAGRLFILVGFLSFLILLVLILTIIFNP